MQSVWFLFWWCPLLSVDCFHKLCLPGTPSGNSQAGWDLRNRIARDYPFEMSLSHEMLYLKYSSVLFKVVVWNELVPHFSNRTLEYLRHNFPSDRLISRQTNNPWPSYSQDLNPPDYFLRGVPVRQNLWKQSTDKRGHNQKRNRTDCTRNAQ